MFSIHCPGHDAEVLLGPSAIEALVNTPDGIALHWRCHCGTRGALGTGRPATPARAPSRSVADAA